MKLYRILAMAVMASLIMTSCNTSGGGSSKEEEIESASDGKYVGQAVGNFSADEWYPGGQTGTTTNVTEGCYEDETPAVTSMGMTTTFNLGEKFFERNFTESTKPFYGLGPASVRKSCLDCHPAYGHGQWQDSYVANGSAAWGNGYLLVIYHPTEEGSNDGPYISEVTGMPQTMAVSPFLPPIDEDQISITWSEIGAMESGLSMTFPDGETYALQYPTLYIPESAFNTDPVPTNLGFRLESTIGVIGTGIIDAIPQDSIKAQYAKEAAALAAAGLDVSEYLNSNFWDAASGDMASTAYYTTLADGYTADGTHYPAGTLTPVKRYTYALTRASLQDGAGANAIWNITNVSRPDRPYLYTTNAWAKAMSENEEVIASIMAAGETSPYYVDVNGDGTVTSDEVAEAVYELLRPGTNQFDNDYHNFEPEMTTDQYYAFMLWHRGLAIPRARNLHKASVQRGKELFMEMGCASCHRPEWNTTDDNYWVPACLNGMALPRYQNQKIYPYSDFVQHKLYMKNDIHGSWCRTTPLWGRGLSTQETGRGDRLHDCRARNTVEAIMWHGYSKKSHAYSSAEKFYNLSKEDRDAVVEFINSI